MYEESIIPYRLGLEKGRGQATGSPMCGRIISRSERCPFLKLEICNVDISL